MSAGQSRNVCLPLHSKRQLPDTVLNMPVKTGNMRVVPGKQHPYC